MTLVKIFPICLFCLFYTIFKKNFENYSALLDWSLIRYV